MTIAALIVALIFICTYSHTECLQTDTVERTTNNIPLPFRSDYYYFNGQSDYTCNIKYTANEFTIQYQGACTLRKPHLSSCEHNSECISDICIDKLCGQQQYSIGSQCNTSLDCGTALACSSSKICTKKAKAGMKCDEVECVDDALCNYAHICQRSTANFTPLSKCLSNSDCHGNETCNWWVASEAPQKYCQELPIGAKNHM